MAPLNLKLPAEKPMILPISFSIKISVGTSGSDVIAYLTEFKIDKNMKMSEIKEKETAVFLNSSESAAKNIKNIA